VLPEAVMTLSVTRQSAVIATARAKNSSKRINWWQQQLQPSTGGNKNTIATGGDKTVLNYCRQ